MLGRAGSMQMNSMDSSSDELRQEREKGPGEQEAEQAHRRRPREGETGVSTASCLSTGRTGVGGKHAPVRNIRDSRANPKSKKGTSE